MVRSAQTRVVSPSMLAPFGIKRQPEGVGAGSLGQVGRPVSGPALRALQTVTPAFFPFRCPAGMPKRNKFRSPYVCRDAQRRADKLGRHARCALFRASNAPCQALFSRKFPRKGPAGQVSLGHAFVGRGTPLLSRRTRRNAGAGEIALLACRTRPLLRRCRIDGRDAGEQDCKYRQD